MKSMAPALALLLASGIASAQMAAPKYPPDRTAEAGRKIERSNPYSEEQARSLLMREGYGDVSSLVKNESGIWEGTARKDGETVNVAVDYQGKVLRKNK
ncbi:hypothetical protein CLG96_07480 [Sphingomonas oleivorans]|uniref:PepSY domain-containing protein n=1 Tax=Sphingomonas oleivorans TaxID=1735121 RepID=A0A2T5G081_9SPHN|nr:hypothetical protein CLG96_07480 [Sphingomonas oleivorans]